MEPGLYRPDQGEECRHMYYSTCDRVESNIDDLPDDDVPADLHFRDIDEQLPTGSVTKQMFMDWLSLGRHDCDVARSLGYTWTENLEGVMRKRLANSMTVWLLIEQRKKRKPGTIATQKKLTKTTILRWKS